MVINNLDVVGVMRAPYETDSPLIVDPNAVLSLTVAAKFLQVVTRRNPQILHRLSVVQHYQLASRDRLDVLEPGAALTVE